MLDVVEALRSANAGRDEARLQMKWARMSESPFAFFRGSCGLFYQRLPQASMPPVSPNGWLCGDLHLENFGSYKGDNRQVCFDINDFDEAALGPVTWDLVRLLTSVQVAARSLAVVPAAAPAVGQRLCTALAAGYADALQAGWVGWVERETAPGLIGELCREMQGRKRADLLEKYTEGEGPGRKIKIGKRAMEATQAQAALASQLVAASPQASADPGFFEVQDVALRISGTGNLGLQRFMVLLRGKGTPDGHCLLDIKQAVPSVLQPPQVAQPPWASQAQRVVALQRRMQAMPAACLQAVAKGKFSYVLRALQPSDEKVVIAADQDDVDRIAEVAPMLGSLLAWAQLRSAGRQGSDPADDLIVYGSARDRWLPAVMEVAALCAEQAVSDWGTFVRARDSGAFGPRQTGLRRRPPS